MRMLLDMKEMAALQPSKQLRIMSYAIRPGQVGHEGRRSDVNVRPDERSVFVLVWVMES